MAKRGTKAGDFYVEGHVDDSGLKRGMADAKNTVERETRDMGDAAERNVGGAFRRVGDTVSKSTEGVRKFASSITETVGVATGLLGVFASVSGIVILIKRGIDSWRDGLKKASELSAGLAENMANASKEVRKQREILVTEVKLVEDIANLEKVRAEDTYKVMSRNQEEVVAQKLRDLGFEIESGFQIKRQIDERLESLKTELGQLRDREGRKQKSLEQEREHVRLINERAEAERLANSIGMEGGIGSFMPDLLPTEDEIVGILEFYREQAYRVEDDLAERRKNAINDANLEWLKNLDPAERLASEAAERLGKAMAEAMGRELQKQFTAQNFAGPVEEMLRRIENQVMALKHRGGL